MQRKMCMTFSIYSSLVRGDDWRLEMAYHKRAIPLSPKLALPSCFRLPSISRHVECIQHCCDVEVGSSFPRTRSTFEKRGLFVKVY